MHMIVLNKKAGIPLYRQLYEALKQSIVSGETTGRLDSIMVCSSSLGISPNTVSAAYQQLTSEGYLRAVPGSGYYVTEMLPAEEPPRKLQLPDHPSADPSVRFDFWNGNATPSLFP